MSYMWSFYSFDYEKFERALALSRRKVVDAVIGEMREYLAKPDDLARHTRVGERLVEAGFSYDGWPARDLKIIDRFAFDLFYVCAEDINIEPESAEFLSPGVTCDFPSYFQKRFWWSRPKPIPPENRAYLYLSFFTHHGRRLGQQTPSFCEYIAFNREETRLLKDEVARFLASPEGHELDAGNYNNIRNDLLGPVSSSAAKGKALLAKLS